MYQRDKVHPCIIGWSLGNESGYGVVHDKMAEWLRNKDRTRLLFYEPASYGPRKDNPLRTMATDVLCPMYARVGQCVTLANMFPDLPLIQIEYAHMMGKYSLSSVCMYVVTQ
jgi:beta-galactosidase/beta-glucuronidase